MTGRLLGGGVALALVLALPIIGDAPPFEASCNPDGTAGVVTPDTRATRKAADARCDELLAFDRDNPLGGWFAGVAGRIGAVAR